MHNTDSRLNADSQEGGRVEQLVADRTRELAALSNHLQALSEREKSELAHKLHDELGGLLTAAKMDLSWLQSRLQDGAYQARLSQLGGVLDEAMDLKRRVVEELRPSLLDHFGLPTALRTYVQSTCNKAGLTAEIDITHACESISKEAAISLFRIVQEGLSNIIRHANAKVVRLQMSGADHECIVTLADDGTGFDSQDPKFRWLHGLMGMRQRVEALNGRLQIESEVHRGTILRVEIPSLGSDVPAGRPLAG